MAGGSSVASAGLAVISAVASTAGNLASLSGIVNGFPRGFLAAAGIAAALAVFAYLQLPGPSLHVGRAPAPTLLLLGGVALGLLTSLLARPFVAIGAGRRRARARRSLDAGVREVARDQVLAPLTAELQAATAFCQALAAARR